jgi:hypothetical protein
MFEVLWLISVEEVLVKSMEILSSSKQYIIFSCRLRQSRL